MVWGGYNFKRESLDAGISVMKSFQWFKWIGMWKGKNISEVNWIWVIGYVFVGWWVWESSKKESIEFHNAVIFKLFVWFPNLSVYKIYLVSLLKMSVQTVDHDDRLDGFGEAPFPHKPYGSTEKYITDLKTCKKSQRKNVNYLDIQNAMETQNK